MKRILTAVISIFSILSCQTSLATTGALFNLSPVNTSANISITLCLNAKAPVSCQNYNVSPTSFTIRTTVPNHTYPHAGIRINTPGYSIPNNFGLNCTPISTGYCMFSVSDTAPVAVTFSVDYIVVGVGTAGALMVKKLSDDMQTSVVGFQNGPNYDQHPLITLSENAALTVLSALVGPPLYTDNETTPQAAADDRNLLWVYALPLGGASSVNAGVWARGTAQFAANWEAVAGSNWSQARIQQLYVALENYTGLVSTPNTRGFNGPLPILQTPVIPPMVSNVFLPALQAALPGVPTILDYNDPFASPANISPRVQNAQSGTNGDLRASSSITFLNSTVMQPNGIGVNGRKLQVLFNTTAQNIIWNGNQAAGVRYNQNGITYSLYARKGVIVTAGIKSSAFLMRSGIGPAPLLHSLNIPVIFDNPNVGNGLADQPHILLVYTTNPNDTPATTSAYLGGNIISALSQTTLGRQLLIWIGTHIDLNNSLLTQITWMPAVGGSNNTRIFRFATINPIPGIALALFDLVQPVSRGSITITSSNPAVEPSMNLGVLSDPADLQQYLEGFEVYIRNITTQLELIDPQYQLIYPDPSILTDPVALTSFIKDNVTSDMHFQGHCRMAPLNQGGVVDSTGHVYGVKNLIVADDSVIPVMVDGAPMSTAYLVALNIANMLTGT